MDSTKVRYSAKVRWRRNVALRLSEEGLKVGQIAWHLGAPKATVHRWLVEMRGARTPVKVEVLRLLDEGRSRNEIVEELGASTNYVRRLEVEHRGAAQRKYRPALERIPEFLEDPEKYRDEEWAQTRNFCKELNFYCSVCLIEDPVGAERAVGLAIGHFSSLLERRRKVRTWRVTLCQLVQALANQAARHRALEGPEKALELLEAARGSSDYCLFCDADLRRREAVALGELGKYDEALEQVAVTRSLYMEHGDFGHDPDANGLASCALVEAWIHVRTGKPNKAVEAAEKAVPMVSQKRSVHLYVMLWYALAVALYRRGRQGDAERASGLCDQHVMRIVSRKERARLPWFRPVYDSQGAAFSGRRLLEEDLVDLRPVSA